MTHPREEENVLSDAFEEAFEKWLNGVSWPPMVREAFEAGYAAARQGIAASQDQQECGCGKTYVDDAVHGALNHACCPSPETSAPMEKKPWYDDKPPDIPGVKMMSAREAVDAGHERT